MPPKTVKFADGDGKATAAPSSLSTPSSNSSALRAITKEIAALTKANFQLDTRLRFIELRIRLIVANFYRRDRFANSNSSSGGNGGGAAADPALVDSWRPSDSQVVLYEQLLSLLWRDVRYLAKLTTLARSQDVDAFLQLVVLTLFGNQYAPTEERQLLMLFHRVLRHEYATCRMISEFMRSNSVFTKMLTVFSRRVSYRSYVVDILKPVLGQMATDKLLKLEINPDKLRQEADFRTAPQAALDAEIARRCTQADALCTQFVQAIVSKQNSMPFGLRFICAQIREEGTARFGKEVEEPAILALVGGFLFLRMLTPAIAAPKAIIGDQLDAGLTPDQRKNYLMVAKVLQNLSNGVLFGEKEDFMKPLTSFLQKNFPVIREYFKTISQISEEDYQRVNSEKWLERALEESEAVVDFSFSEIRLLHQMCVDHADKLVVVDRRSTLSSPLPGVVTPTRITASMGAVSPVPSTSSSSSSAYSSANDVPLSELILRLKQFSPPPSRVTDDGILSVRIIKRPPPALSLISSPPSSKSTFPAAGASKAPTMAAEVASPLDDEIDKSGLVLWEWDDSWLEENVLRRSELQAKLSAKLDELQKIKSKLSQSRMYKEERATLYEQYLTNVRNQPTMVVKPAEKKCKFSMEQLEKKGIVLSTSLDKSGVEYKALRVAIHSPETGSVALSVLALPTNSTVFSTKMQVDELLEKRACGQAAFPLSVDGRTVVLSTEGLVRLYNELFLARR